MKTSYFFPLLCSLILTVFLVGCAPDELGKPIVDDNKSIDYRDQNNCGTVTLTYPLTVPVGESFTIDADIECGRISLDRGFIIVDGDTVYNGITCATPNLQWKQVVNNQCYTTDLSVTQTLTEVGTNVYRTKHGASDGNCDNFNPPGPGNPGECTDFNGNNFCCFVIEAIVLEECTIDTGDYFTYSQGFYLNSKNGADFLDAHPELGPVTVGCAGGTTTTYTLDEIVALEPGNSSLPGILVKQIITMTLNVSASGFLGSGDDLDCLVVVADEDPLTTVDDLFEGMTVNEILDAANAFAGGCDTASFTSGDLTAVLSAIVDNFHLGEENGGLLTCCTN